MNKMTRVGAMDTKCVLLPQSPHSPDSECQEQKEGSLLTLKVTRRKLMASPKGSSGHF